MDIGEGYLWLLTPRTNAPPRGGQGGQRGPPRRASVRARISVSADAARLEDVAKRNTQARLPCSLFWGFCLTYYYSAYSGKTRSKIPIAKITKVM